MSTATRNDLTIIGAVYHDDIGGSGEVCELAGVTRKTLKSWREREDFPKPVRSIMSGDLWDLAHVRAWLKARR